MSDKRRFVVEVELRQPDVPTTDYALAGTLEDVFRQYKDITGKCNHIASVRYIIEQPAEDFRPLTQKEVSETSIATVVAAHRKELREFVDQLDEFFPDVP